MKIKEDMQIFKAQITFKRTPKGRSINEYGVNSLKAALEDTKNQEAEVVICQNCGMHQSSLLMEDGCKNCGYKQKTV